MYGAVTATYSPANMECNVNTASYLDPLHLHSSPLTGNATLLYGHIIMTTYSQIKSRALIKSDILRSNIM